MSIEARRHSPRIQLNETAYINFGAGSRGVILDVSEGGLRFKTTSALDTVNPVRFWLTFNRRTEGTAALAWTDENRTMGGLRFTTLPTEMREQIRSWMDRSLETEVTAQAPANVEVNASPSSQTVTTIASEPELSATSIPASKQTPDTALDVSSHRQSSVASSEEENIVTAAAPVPVPNEQPAAKRLAEPVTENVVEQVVEPQSRPLEPVLSPMPALVGQENRLSMFPAQSAPTESYASNALTSPTTSDHRFAVIGLVVLFALAAAAGGAAYYYPSEVRGVISSVQAKVTRSINAHRQPASTAEAAAMAGSPARDPAFAGNLESVPPPPDGSTGSTAAPIPAPPPSTADTQPTPDATNSKAARTSDAVLTKNNSQADVELAQTYLARGTTPDEKAKAVQLLWLATEKGNVDAELRLADLYARGDSVPKSCVQARILLKAAAVANPSAAQPKLVELDDSGCN
jgi:hypothetical protein